MWCRAHVRWFSAAAPPRKTNCCLVLTPLVFSVVLGSARTRCGLAHDARTRADARRPYSVVSFVLNTILFASPDFKCGCRCRAYSTPDGEYTFDINDVRPLTSRLRPTADARAAQPRYTNVVNGVNVWKTPLIDNRNQCVCLGGGALRFQHSC